MKPFDWILVDVGMVVLGFNVSAWLRALRLNAKSALPLIMILLPWIMYLIVAWRVWG